MAGFFGFDWTHNVSLVPIIEQINFNITLAGYENFNNSNNYLSIGGNNASLIWENIYLADATKRLKALAGGYNWTVADTYNGKSHHSLQNSAGLENLIILVSPIMLHANEYL